jgi:hypothetical protein
VLHRPNLALVTGALAHRVRVERGPPQVRRRQLPCANRPPGVNGQGEVIGRIRSDPALDAPDLQIHCDVLARHGL